MIGTSGEMNKRAGPDIASKIAAVTFDLDDTLWPVWPAIGRAEKAMLSWLEEHAPKIVDRFGEMGLQELRDKIAAQKPDLAYHISLIRILTMREAAQQVGYPPEVGERAFQVMWEERNRVDFFADVKPVLRTLRKQGLTLGALSNGNADVGQVGLGQQFDFSLNAISGGEPKPAVKMFLRAAELAGCMPTEMIHVGDDLASDVAGAAAAGFFTVWLNRSGDSDSLNFADFEIRSLQELPALINQLSDSVER